jgi:hypothetical protein
VARGRPVDLPTVERGPEVVKEVHRVENKALALEIARHVRGGHLPSCRVPGVLAEEHIDHWWR